MDFSEDLAELDRRLTGLLGLRTPAVAISHAAPPDAVRAQLEGMLGQMIGLEYVAKEEIPQIPTRTRPSGGAVYAPLARAPLPPDLVLVRAATASTRTPATTRPTWPSPDLSSPGSLASLRLLQMPMRPSRPSTGSA